MKLFENICLGVVTAGAGLLLFEGAIFFRAARLELEPVAFHAQDALMQAENDLRGLSIVEAELLDSTGKVSAAADQQAAYWQKTQLQVYKLITDTKEIMVRTDRSVNDVLVPRVAASLEASTALEHTAAASVTETTDKIDATVEELRPAIDNLVRATAAAASAGEAAAKDMSDPAIHETLVHVDGVSGNLDATSSDIQAFVHRETAPVRGTWNVVKKFLQEFAGPAAQVATAAK